MKSARKRRASGALLAIAGSLAIVAMAAGRPGTYDFHTFQIPGASYNDPYGITNQGLVTGIYYVPGDPPYPAFLYTVKGGFVPVSIPLPGAVGTQFYQVNQQGKVATAYGTEDGHSHSAVYDSRRGTWEYLPDPDPTSAFSGPGGINDRGQLFGNWTDGGINHGWVYERGRYTFFDAPDVAPDNWGTIVYSGNNRGDCVGWFVDAQGRTRGFIRHGNSGRVEPIDVPGAEMTSALGINDRGTVVGSYYDPSDGILHGFLLSDGEFTALDAPGAVSTFLNGINDRGDLVGSFYDSWDAARNTAFIASRRGKCK